MPNKFQPFRQHHVTRAVRGAVAAGMSNPRVEVHLTADGATIAVVGGKKDGGKTQPAASAISGKQRRPSSRSHPAR